MHGGEMNNKKNEIKDYCGKCKHWYWIAMDGLSHYCSEGHFLHDGIPQDYFDKTRYVPCEDFKLPAKYTADEMINFANFVAPEYHFSYNTLKEELSRWESQNGK
jgi:hypothetical protein